jgi:hypothetical protein
VSVAQRKQFLPLLPLLWHVSVGLYLDLLATKGEAAAAEAEALALEEDGNRSQDLEGELPFGGPYGYVVVFLAEVAVNVFSSFGRVEDLQVSDAEQIDLLVKWLGTESSPHAVSIRSSNAGNPKRGLQRLWERLDERYGSWLGERKVSLYTTET